MGPRRVRAGARRLLSHTRARVQQRSQVRFLKKRKARVEPRNVAVASSKRWSRLEEMMMAAVSSPKACRVVRMYIWASICTRVRALRAFHPLLHTMNDPSASTGRPEIARTDSGGSVPHMEKDRAEDKAKGQTVKWPTAAANREAYMNCRDFRSRGRHGTRRSELVWRAHCDCQYERRLLDSSP